MMKTSLEFLQSIYRDVELPPNMRLRAAIAACPFEHPRLAVTVVAQANEDFAKRLELAITRSNAVIAERAKPVPLVSDLRLPPSQFDRRLRRI
jgi:hypothetical protein